MCYCLPAMRSLVSSNVSSLMGALGLCVGILSCQAHAGGADDETNSAIAASADAGGQADGSSVEASPDDDANADSNDAPPARQDAGTAVNEAIDTPLMPNNPTIDLGKDLAGRDADQADAGEVLDVPGDAGVTECDLACAAAGGTCVDQRCRFDCSGDQDCHEPIDCPDGFPCTVACGQESCGDITCPSDSECIVQCMGESSCSGQVECHGPDCQVYCDGADSCRVGISGGASRFLVACSGFEACGEIDCGGNDCGIACSGVGSCFGDVSTSAPTGKVQCIGDGSCKGDVSCNASKCDVRCMGDMSCQGAVYCNAGQALTDCP